MTTATLDARAFAGAWLNVSLASGKAEASPALCNTVLVEFYGPQTVRLTATDSVLLLTCVVDETSRIEDGETDLEVLPDEAFIVIDTDNRMKALMKYALTDAIRAAKNDLEPPEIRLAARAASSATAPALMPELERRELVVDVEEGRERLVLETYDGSYPNWRTLLLQHEAEDAGQVGFSIDTLNRLGSLKETGGRPLTLKFGKKHHGVRLSVDCEPMIEGLFMASAIWGVTHGIEP